MTEETAAPRLLARAATNEEEDALIPIPRYSWLSKSSRSIREGEERGREGGSALLVLRLLGLDRDRLLGPISAHGRPVAPDLILRRKELDVGEAEGLDLPLLDVAEVAEVVLLVEVEEGLAIVAGMHVALGIVALFLWVPERREVPDHKDLMDVAMKDLRDGHNPEG